MATGGSSDHSSDGLDLTEIESELAALDESNELDDTKDSVVWEENKAEEGYANIEAETSGETDFLGFHTPDTSPNTLSEEYFATTQSAPTSPTTLRAQSLLRGTKTTNPRLAQSNLTVQDQIKTFESLAQLNPKTSPKLKSNTRSAIKKGLGSPLVAAGDFKRKHKHKSKAEKVSLPAPQPVPIVIMAQVNISGAGRLNPRERRAGGVGDTLENLGFPVLNQENIPAAGRNVLHTFTPLRK